MTHGNEKGRDPKAGKAGFQLPRWFFVLCILTLVPGFGCTTTDNNSNEKATSGTHEYVLGGATEEAQRFIDINRNVTLTPEQEAVRVAALSQLPAPCCSEFTAATCCCECNLTRAIWGLSKSLIVNGADVSEVRDAVAAWTKKLNPSGYAGDACFKGRCKQSITEDACGGMDENNLISSGRE